MWLVLPLLPSQAEPTEDQIQRPVDLIELSPVEQSRLPDVLIQENQTQNQMPDGTADFGDFFGMQPPGLSMSPIPGQPPARLTPTLPPFFVPPPPPAAPSTPFQLPPSRFPPLGSRSTAPITPTVRPNLERQLEVEREALDSPSAEATPTPTLTPGTTPPELEPGAADLQTTPATQANPSPSPSDVAANEDEAANGPEALERSPELTQTLLADVEANPELYAYSASGTTTDETTESYLGWLATASEWMGEDYDPADYGADAPVRNITATVPQQACVIGELDQVQPAIVGLAVDAEGQLVDEPPPTLLRSTGYEFLNRRALTQAKLLSFEGTGIRQAVRVEVDFVQADACDDVEEVASAPVSTVRAESGDSRV
jgi:hypothetical protein